MSSVSFFVLISLYNQSIYALKQRDFSLSLRFPSSAIRQARALKCVLHYVCVKYKKIQSTGSQLRI